jgi:hypothetical protein
MWAEHPAVTVFAIPACLGPDADGQMVWWPGAPPIANTLGERMPKRMGLAFVVLGGGVEHGALTRFEDGAGVVLPAAEFARVREALEGGANLVLPLPEGYTLELEVRPTRIADPFSGGAIVGPEGFDRYEPENRRVRTGPLEVFGIVVLVPTPLVAQRVSIERLADYVRRLEAVVDEAAIREPPADAFEVSVEVRLRPGEEREVRLATRPDGPRPLLEAVHRELRAVEPPAVTGEIAFRIDGRVHAVPEVG